MPYPTYPHKGLSLLGGLLIRRKIFVSYHHGGDQWYYDELSKHFAITYDVVYDSSVDRLIDSNDAEYQMRKIREDYISGTSCTLILCGAETPNRKFVDWEIKATLDKQHALVGVYLPTARRTQPTLLSLNDTAIIVPARFHANHQTGFARFKSWEDLFNPLIGLKYIVEEAVQHAQSNTRLINNTLPLMSRNL